MSAELSAEIRIAQREARVLAHAAADYIEWGAWVAARQAAEALSRKLLELHELQTAQSDRLRQLELLGPVSPARQTELFSKVA